LDSRIGKGKTQELSWQTSQSYGIENKGKLHEMAFGKSSGETQEMVLHPVFEI
jgi:hypothetical protein